MHSSRLRSVNVVDSFPPRLAATRLRLPKPGLGFKFLLIALGVGLFSVITSSLLVLSFERQHIIENTETTRRPLSTIIWASLEHAMLNNDQSMVDQILQRMASEGGFERIRILNPDGIVRISSAGDDVGRRLFKDQAECQTCHLGGIRPVQRTATLLSETNYEVSLEVVAIRNRPDCMECHNTRNEVLGILMVETPLTFLPKQLTATLSGLALSSLITALVLLGLMALALSTLVTRPVKELIRGVTEIGAGNLSYCVPATSEDELGELARAFEATRQQLRCSHDEMEQRNRELSEVNAMALTVSQLLDVDRILHAVLDTVVNKLRMDSVCVYLRDSHTGQFVLHTYRGIDDIRVQAIQTRRQQPKWDISGKVGRTGQVVFVPDMALDGRFQGLWDDLRHRSYIHVPLRSRAGQIGTMGIATPAGQPLKAWEVKILEVVGYIAGVSLENAHLYEQIHQFATIEERSRLAREMHDDLAQILGLLKTHSAFANELLSRGDIERARASLVELRDIADEAYRDARDAIHGLRDAGSPPRGLEPRLREQVEQYRSRYGIDLEFITDKDLVPDISAAVEVQVVRIIQEALTNIRKHGRVKRAWLRLAQTCAETVITIEDDGAGFDVNRACCDKDHHFGLQIMRERAESVGGTLEVKSSPGNGARVTVRVPRPGVSR